jgi:uncharacterized DUF497 family protein
MRQTTPGIHSPAYKRKRKCIDKREDDAYLRFINLGDHFMKEFIGYFSGFDWDAGNWPKCGKHGVSREEIEHLFIEGPAIFPDPKHSERETRYLAIGTTREGRWIFAAFTIRRRSRKNFIRPISARYMHDKEVRHYERQRQGKGDSRPEDG